MARFTFRITGVSRGDLRRWRQRGGENAPRGGPSRALRAPSVAGWVAAAVVVLTTGDLLQRRAAIGGATLIAKNVLVVLDNSGSMGGTGSLLAAQMATLREAGMTLREQTARGYGAASTGDRDNFRNRLAAALAEPGAVDAVYLFSDFAHQAEFAVDGNDEAGYAELRRLLARHRLRLYLGTVRDAPPPEMVAVARQSGGGLIEGQAAR